MKKEKKSSTAVKDMRFGGLKALCWGILPAAIVAVLILDGLGVYSFSTERLVVLGAALLVVLLPFFSEVTVKNISIKRDNGDK